MTALQRPIIWLLGAGMVVAAIIASWIGLAQLDDQRTAMHLAERNAAGDQLPVKGFVPKGAAYTAHSREAAAEALRSRLIDDAIARRLLVERIELRPVDRAASAALVAHLAVSGPEAAVLQYASALERSRPLIRLIDWRLQRTSAGDGTIRLDARAAALWEGS